MPAKEIKHLREAGRLDDALAMAQDELNTQPDNIWTKRNISWVYYAFLKEHVQKLNFDGFIENIIKINNLNLPKEDVIIFDKSAYQIGSFIFKFQNSVPVDYSKVNQLFDIIKEFHFTKPSEAYSFIYKAFHKGYKNWSRYLEFADWWDFNHFNSDDYLNEKYNEKDIMSIVEQAYIAYSKKLLEGKSVDEFDFEHGIDIGEIQTFLPKLESIIEKHPNYQYPPFFKAKLLLALGSSENALSAFLPFAKQNKNNFWVWGLLADIFPKEKDIQFACYCKALSLKTPEDFLVKTRQIFSRILMKREMYNEAKTEIQFIISIRNKNEWKISNEINEWINQDWYKSARAKKDNQDLYSSHIKQAEEILFQDIPEEIIVVEFVNENKSMLNFVKDKRKFGFFNYSSNLTKPQIGNLLKVRFNGDGQDGFYKILTAKQAEADNQSEAIKMFVGSFKMIHIQNFGFVDDIFIDSKLVKEKNLISGQVLSGKAIISFNKKKSEWGWKAIELI